MREEIDPPELRVARIAARQHGVATAGQLRAAGVEKSAISRRVRAGRLHRIHHGVYAVGHGGLSREGRWMAAVLAGGEGAVLSHGSAAVLWALLRPFSGQVDVSVATRGGRGGRRGIRIHRCRSLPAAQRSSRLRIPVTTPARTIEDITGVLAPGLVRRATRQAEIAGFRLGPRIDSDRSRSDLERDFLRLCRRYELPTPEVNVKVGRWTVDFLWRAEGIAVETDFYGYHRGRVAFRDDRARDLDLRRHGFVVHRFSEEQIDDRPAEVAADLRDALALAS